MRSNEEDSGTQVLLFIGLCVILLIAFILGI
jgi:hypothetical protein